MSNDLGLDRSGNNNHFTVSNLTHGDQMLDSPTNNFATFNILYWNPTRENIGTYSEGNLKEANIGDCMAESTIAVTTGKWYFEARTVGDNMIGIGATNKWGGDGVGYGDSIGVHSNGKYIANGSHTGVNVDTSLPFNSGTHIIMMAFDLDNQRIWFGRGGTWHANPASAAGVDFSSYATLGDSMAVALRASNGNNESMHMNFGQDSSFAGAVTAQGNQDDNAIGDFYYDVPAGFLALCTKNLPDIDVVPSNHFNTVLYNGDASEQAITGVGFQPDFVWVKHRQDGRSNGLVDAVRGATKVLVTDTTAVEATMAQSIKSLDVDGFTLGTDQTIFNESGGTPKHVSWNWKAGAGNTAFSESGNNPAGTHNANVEAGFSIVSYVGTGAAGTVAHGLGAAPEWIFIKNRDVNDAWAVYYGDNTDYLVFDEDATADAATYFNDTSPSATVFTVNTAHSVNADGENYIAYCWREIDGYSKIGSYIGNSNVFGQFAYTGFRPAFVMFKRADGVEHWTIFDNKRDPQNIVGQRVHPSLINAETDGTGATAIIVDFTATGFKIRGTSANMNDDADTYIFMAFAETPFKYANAR